MIDISKYTLLYVEDDSFISEMVMDYLSDFFHTIYLAVDGVEAFNIYKEKKPNIIITDIKMPKMNGLELTSKIREIDSNIPILITTAYTTTDYLLEAVELNLVKYLIKPIEEEKLEEALLSCFQKLELDIPSLIKLTKEHQYNLFGDILTKNNIVIPLTSSQIKFLKLLITNKNRAITYSEIESVVWKDKPMSDAALRSLVHDLRKIIHKDIIKNVSKTGYKIQLHE